MRTLLAAVLLALMPSSVASAETTGGGLDIEQMRGSVVQIHVTSQPEDYYTPWQRPRARGSSGSGFYIGDGRLVTNAHVISDAKNLELKRADRPGRVQARVLHAGHDCDLAIITTDDASFFEGMKPLGLGPRPAMRSTVATVGYPMGGEKLSVTEGVVSRIEVRTYVHTGADAHLTIQTDAAINPGNSGGPVIQDGKVVGVAFQGQFFAQNIGYMIPPSVIAHFLSDVEDGRYDGYPELGLYTESLENDAHRRYLGVPKGQTGVLVLKAVPYASCAGKLERNDVLHAIDGYPIQNDGTILIEGDFFEHTHIVEGKQIGETVTLRVRRAGEVMDIPIELKAWGARMSPATAYDERPEYLVYGGYVFCPVTANYLDSTRDTEELTYYYQQYYRTVAEEGKSREQLVVLSRVLPDPSTAYRSYTNRIVASVNDVEPKDFAAFVSLLEQAEDSAVIAFEGVAVPPLILDKARIAAVHAKICERLGVTNDRYVARPEGADAQADADADADAELPAGAGQGGK